MRFIIPINEVEDNGSQTCHVIETNSSCKKTNRRKLREYFLVQGVPLSHLKRVMKAMGFVGDNLGQ